jgi:hypothetical protein
MEEGKADNELAFILGAFSLVMALMFLVFMLT